MNKLELVKKLSQELFLSKRQVTDFLDCLIYTVCEELKRGGFVRIQGFGTFSAEIKRVKYGINPITKEKVEIGKNIEATFRSGKLLKDL